MEVNTRVNKNFTGYIEYRYSCPSGFGNLEEYTDEDMFEEETFSNLTEMLKKISQPHMDKIKESLHNVVNIWVHDITFVATNENNRVQMSLTENLPVNVNATINVETDKINNTLTNHLRTIRNEIDKIMK